MTMEAAETPVTPALEAKRSGQNPSSAATEAASFTAVRESAHEEPTELMSAVVARQVKDKRVLKLIRAYLNAGICEGGLVTARREGTPQGGRLSPLLSNVLLTDLDRELEKRGHWFCRYADDCNIYVKSEKAGGRCSAGAVDGQ